MVSKIYHHKIICMNLDNISKNTGIDNDNINLAKEFIQIQVFFRWNKK